MHSIASNYMEVDGNRLGEVAGLSPCETRNFAKKNSARAHPDQEASKQAAQVCSFTFTR